MACYYCDRSPCVCTPSMFDDVPRPLPSEMAIRADERAKVEREVVAFLLRRTRVRGLFQSVASILEELQRGEHRPNPGQPKEGGDDGTER